MLNRFSATLLLILATMFWGFAFIAQKSAMDAMGPLTFIAARYLLGGLVVLPVGFIELRRVAAAQRGSDELAPSQLDPSVMARSPADVGLEKIDPAPEQAVVRRAVIAPWQWAALVFLSVNFFLGTYLQQAGLVTASVTNSGFLTGLYVFFVPIILLVLFRVRPHPVVWLSAPLAGLGLFLLNGGRLEALEQGDTLVISSAIFWALHVLMLGYLATQTRRPIFISAMSFLIAGTMALAGSLLFEAPTLANLTGGWIQIAYAGLISTAIAFTLQAVGQVHVPPSNAAIILSGEALFAALGAAVALGERLTPTGYAGATLMFLAIVLVETIPAFGRRAEATA